MAGGLTPRPPPPRRGGTGGIFPLTSPPKSAKLFPSRPLLTSYPVPPMKLYLLVLVPSAAYAAAFVLSLAR
jgi:hypothetical protein